MKSLIVEQHLRARKGGMIKTLAGFRPAVMTATAMGKDSLGIPTRTPNKSILSALSDMHISGGGTPAHKKISEALSSTSGRVVRKPLKFKY